MKSRQLFPAVFVTLCGCLITAVSYAEEVDCLIPETTVESATDVPKCPECPPCADTESCPDEQSCQPGDPLITPEEQQYPLAPGDAWVAAAVDVNTLVDVPVNDPRWQNRSQGEVFARENGDTIVWYWPNCGDVVFDTTSLGDHYTWSSYIYDTGEQPSGGPSPTATEHAIHFQKGRGVTIFKRADVFNLPNDADFLKSYTNIEQAKVPADGMYPFGQRMWLSGYSDNSSDLTRMKNAGFTLSGPHYHGCSPYDYHPNMEKIDNNGMKAFWRLYTGSGGWGAALKDMETPNGRNVLRGKIERCINAVLDNPLFDRTVVAWYGSPEEPIDRPSTPIDKLREYMEFVRTLIVELDPKQRPLFWSERGDSSASNMKANAQHAAGIMKQNYLMKSNNYDYTGKEMDERFLIGHWVQNQKKADRENLLPYTCKHRPIIATLSMYVDPEDITLRSEAWLSKAITHDVYLSIAMGAHGINMYTFANSATYSQKTKKLQENLYLEVIGQFALADLPAVFLWGDERSDVQMEILKGPETFQWQKYHNIYSEPSIKFRNIQYGENRYLLLVNSSKEPVTMQLSGFQIDRQPIRILDVIKNTWHQLGVTLTPTLQPLGVKMYKISRE